MTSSNSNKQTTNSNVINKTKFTYSLKEESAVSNSLFKYTTDYTAKELMKYFLLAKKKVDKFEITDAADKKFTVNDGKKSMLST